MRYYKVDLDGSAYTYGWAGDEPLSPGDEVTIPGNVVNPEPTVRMVIRELAKPDYDPAKIKNILAKTPRQGTLFELDDLMDELLDDNAYRGMGWDPDPSADDIPGTFNDGPPDDGYDDITFDPSVHG